MIPFPSGMFGGAYDPFLDASWLFGASMYRAQDWDIVSTNQLRLRDFRTGNFAYSSTAMRREDNGATKCWVPSLANQQRQLNFHVANPSWESLLTACPAGVSIVVAGYSKVTQNASLGYDFADVWEGTGAYFPYKPNSGDTNKTWWYPRRHGLSVEPYAFKIEYCHGSPFALNEIGWYHDQIPGCATSGIHGTTILTPGYVPGDFVMLTLSLTATGPKAHFNTTDLGTPALVSGTDGRFADVRPARWHDLDTQFLVWTTSAMRTVFAGIYNEPLSANAAKLTEIYNTLKAF